MGKPLVIIGNGPDRAKIERLAGPNVKLLGYQRARAFIFAADEDFGIAPAVAQAAGCPVIAYGKGGALETVVGWPRPDATGVFFDAQTPQVIRAAVEFFESHEAEFQSQPCRRNAERFSSERFQEEFRTTVGALWDRFQRGERIE